VTRREPELIKQETIRHWTAEPAGASLAAGYERGSEEFFDVVERTRYRLYPWLLVDYLQPERWSGKDVLEVGVGLGTDHLQLARAGARLTGVDLAPASIESTRRLLDFHGYNSELAVADAEHLPFDDSTFDSVYSFGVIHHTPDMNRAIRELHRVLRPKGSALVALYNRHSYFYVWRLARFLLRLEWRDSTLEQMRSKIEYGGGNPLVVVSSRRELDSAFQSFSRVLIEARHLPRHRIPSRLLGVLGPLLRPLERRVGWYWMVEATR
jgi:ubiquinone/menaquinone biosynthesis C-methylase UbiE